MPTYPYLTTIQSVLDYVRTKPTLTQVLGNPITGLGGNAIPIAIANKVMQFFLQENFAWKWNRQVPIPFVLNNLQQDYSTSITNLGWLEDCIRIEINNPQYTPPSAPDYPKRGVETVRELLPTSAQATISQICWIPNSEALATTWQANTLYTNPALGTNMPVQPWTQVWDSNGNLQVLTGWGTTGATQPTWGTTVNGTTTDGTVTWTMADPNGITWRVSPCPPQAGIVYLIQPYYQKKPPTILTIGSSWSPIPDDLRDTYETGFEAYAWDCAEDEAKFEKKLALFTLKIKKALSSVDREQESFGFFPGRSLTGVSGTWDRGSEQYPPGLFAN